MNTSTAQNLIGRRIRYMRTGSRSGWEGELVKVNDRRITIDYDNGVEQDYSITALIDEKAAFNLNSNAYLGLIEVADVEPIKATKPTTSTIPKKAFLVINMSTGSIMGCSPDEYGAEIFAKEQAEDSNNHTVFTVFGPRASFVIKRPLAERVKGFFTDK